MTLSRLLQGKQVRLAALTESDMAVMAGWYQDADFLRLYDSRPAHPKTKAELDQWLQELRQAKNTFIFAVRPVKDDELVGYLELDEIDWQHGVCGLGLGIGDPAHRDKGYGYEATQLALAFAFNELNLHRVQVTVFSYNARSRALIEKLGFQREGVFREYLQRDGQRHDMLLYGLLRHEWSNTNQLDSLSHSPERVPDR